MAKYRVDQDHYFQEEDNEVAKISTAVLKKQPNYKLQERNGLIMPQERGSRSGLSNMHSQIEENFSSLGGR